VDYAQDKDKRDLFINVTMVLAGIRSRAIPAVTFFGSERRPFCKCPKTVKMARPPHDSSFSPILYAGQNRAMDRTEDVVDSLIDFIRCPVSDLPVWKFVVLKLLPFSLVVSIGGAALWERVLSKPRLTIVPFVNNPKPTAFTTEQVVNGRRTRNTTAGRVLQVEVRNASLRLLSWRGSVIRAATNCTGVIEFITYPGGLPACRPMEGRWAESDEPVIHSPMVGLISAPQLVQKARDVRPGDKQVMDVVVHHDGDRVVYGWTNASHTVNPRLPAYRLPEAYYRVKVTITANEGKWEGFLWLYCEAANGGRYSLHPVVPFRTTS
jgi:hypothetical protein